jgi:hypothetical protein
MKSYYLSSNNRLADVIAAIQVMGTYKFYKLDFKGWSDRISGDVNLADHWQQIFVQHPEFFRLDSKREKASLVWRRQYPKRYNVDQLAIMSNSEYEQLPNETKLLRVSRQPLQSDEIQALIETAIDLHSKALELKQDRRWWIPLVAGFIGGLIGTILGFLINGTSET